MTFGKSGAPTEAQLERACAAALRVLVRRPEKLTIRDNDDALALALSDVLAPYARVVRGGEEGGGHAIVVDDVVWGHVVVDDARAFAGFADLAADIAAHVHHRAHDTSLLRLALGSIDEGVFLMRGDSPAFLYVNEAAANTLGYTRDELQTKTVLDIDPTVTPERWRELTRHMAIPRGTIETWHRARDGKLIPVEVTRNIFEYGGVTYNIAASRDLSARNAAARALEESAAAYRSLVENTPDFILRWNRALERVYVNQGFADAMGTSVAELVGRRFGSQHPAEAASTLTTAEAAIRRVLDTGEPTMIESPLFSVWGKRTIQMRLVPERDATGAVTNVLGIGRDITALKERERELQTLADHVPDAIARISRTGEVRFSNSHFASLAARDDGVADEVIAQICERLPQATPEVTESTCTVALTGGARHFNVRLVAEAEDTVLAIVRDVTAQRALEEQFLHAQKMEAVGRLAGGLVHDFNNMLAVIQVQAALLGEENDTPSVQEAVTEISGAAQRAANLTRQLLTFSRRQTKNPINLDLADSLVSTARMLKRVLGEDVVVETRLRPVPLVHADPHMIDQVVMNLAINARDAMTEGGRLVIALDDVDVDVSVRERHPLRAPGHYVRLTVEDNGCGIPEDNLQRIFEPFFTTKEIGKGTGLGLATVAAIVDQHDGFVDVHSAEGRGSRFELFFPVAPSQVQTLVRTTSGTLLRGSESVLLVEDDASVRATARFALEKLGYRVLEAESAMTALPLWRSRAPRVQLLLTDLILPTLSGHHLASMLQHEDPELRVLFMSGYSPDLVSDLQLDQKKRILQKPFSIEQLAASVRQVLDAVST